jgi:hypothetical protein
MTYYIILEGESKEVIQYDSGILGNTTQTTFYPEKGFTRFTKIVNEFPDMLETATILDETNKKYTPNEFLKKISKLKIASI